MDRNSRMQETIWTLKQYAIGGGGFIATTAAIVAFALACIWVGSWVVEWLPWPSFD